MLDTVVASVLVFGVIVVVVFAVLSTVSLAIMVSDRKKDDERATAGKTIKEIQ